MTCHVSVALVVALAGSAAQASISVGDPAGVRTLDGRLVAGNFSDRGVPATNFSAYTGVTSPTNQLFLIEVNPAPVRDDIVTLGSTNEQINDYVAAAGSVQRFVTSSVGPGNQPGQSLITITISGRDAAGALADLWPAGFTGPGAVPLTGGGFGVGLNLGAALGNVPLGLAPDNFVVAADFTFVTNGLGTTLGLPLAFFGPHNSNWNGTFGLSLGNATAGLTSDLTLRVLIVPAPAAGATLAFGGLLVARRRRL